MKGISVKIPSPLDIAEFWRKRKKDKCDNISEYFNKIAQDAKQVTTFWNGLVDEINQGLFRKNSGQNLEDYDEKMDRILFMLQDRGILIRPNPSLYNLEQHYKELSTVVGGQVSVSVQNKLTMNLSELIVARHKVNDTIIKAISMFKINNKLTVEEREAISDAIKSLNQATAQLDILASTFKLASQKS